MRAELAAVITIVFVGCSAPPRAEVSAPVGKGASYPLLLLRGAPYVDLDVGGARGTFLIDTGANASGVDAEWLKSVHHRDGARSTVGGTTGALPVGRAVLDRLDLGTSFFVEPSFTVQSFARFERPPGRAQSGLLGMDFLATVSITIDWRTRRLEVARAPERAAVANATAVVLAMPGNLPTIDARVGGVTIPCRLDTGATWSDPRALLDVNRAAVAALERAGVALASAGKLGAIGVGGGDELAVLEAPGLALELGPARIEPITLVVHERGTLAVDHPLALAGATLLERLGWIRLDPREGIAWIPGREGS